jgi:hypothetical protein
VRVLFLTHRLPFAPNRGDRIRAYHLLRVLARVADVHLVSLVHDEEEASHSGDLRDVVVSGSKVALERLTLPPSWLLETSPRNYQAGYLLREPLNDGLVADYLMNAIVAAGLCDPGANGPRARLARLPVAINSKHSPIFRCRMRVWSGLSLRQGDGCEGRGRLASDGRSADEPEGSIVAHDCTCRYAWNIPHEPGGSASAKQAWKHVCKATVLRKLFGKNAGN